MPSGPALTPAPFGCLAPGALSVLATCARQATGTHLHQIDGYSLVDGTVTTSTTITGGHHWELLYYPTASATSTTASSSSSSPSITFSILLSLPYLSIRKILEATSFICSTHGR
ncbi:unnamed protein product [Urochloa humidicola]